MWTGSCVPPAPTARSGHAQDSLIRSVWLAGLQRHDAFPHRRRVAIYARDALTWPRDNALLRTEYRLRPGAGGVWAALPMAHMARARCARRTTGDRPCVRGSGGLADHHLRLHGLLGAEDERGHFRGTTRRQRCNGMMT